MNIIAKHIMVSIYVAPATFEELIERDFLKNININSIDYQIYFLLKEGFIYQRGKKYFAFKNKVKKFLGGEYEL